MPCMLAHGRASDAIGAELAIVSSDDVAGCVLGLQSDGRFGRGRLMFVCLPRASRRKVSAMQQFHGPADHAAQED